MNSSKHTPIYNFTVALFLYATMLVDIYRKLIAVNTTQVRNVIYIFALVLIVWDMFKTKKIIPMLVLGMVMSFLYLLSSLINTGYEQVYITSWFMFISRLWPAFYIGRYTDDWSAVSSVVRRFLLLAIVYAFLAYLSPNDSTVVSKSYSTIAANLFFVVWIAFYDSITKRKYILIILCLICFFPVLFLGTRACMFGAVFAIVLIMGRVISKSSVQKKARYYVVLIVGAVILTMFFTVMSDALLELLPNSRSLRYLVKGDMFDDSNRSESVYSRLILSLKENPVGVRGLLGDQIFLAGNNTSIDYILSSFAHNVYLELCLNFGVVFGIIIGLYFTFVLLKAYKKSKYCNDDLAFVFLGVLGMTFVNMLVSFSWLHAYEVWLLFGLAYSLIRGRSTIKTI